MSQDDSTIIDNGRMRICVEAKQFKGRDYVDVRNYYTDGDGTLKPTAKGVMVQAENLLDVIEAMRLAGSKFQALEKPVSLYYFERRQLEDGDEHHKVSERRVFEKLSGAVKCSPSEFDALGGYIFKSLAYSLTGSMYVFNKPVPVARWSKRDSKWKRVKVEGAAPQPTEAPTATHKAAAPKMSIRPTSIRVVK